ncbi:MAG TPA: dihydrolipoamide acetyltransferase family protein, partial [Flavobacteriaceae bacterium]|nr:dihydrolipoamide acetyltransferase family protein [Flavobacteriaceae bacterium]
MSEETKFPQLREFKMPKMGESITEGTILNWLVSVGDSFHQGEVLLEVATDKVDNEIPAPFSGKVVEIKHAPKTVVKVGETIAVLEITDASDLGNQETSSEITEEKQEKKIEKKKSVSTKPETRTPKPIFSNNTKQNPFISPLVLSIAKQHHISFEELARIPGTGKDGRLRKSDVFKYLEEGRPFQFAQTYVQDPTAYRIPQLNLDKGTGKIIEMDRMRQLIADHMVYSKHTSPHVTSYVEADMSQMVRWRDTHKEAFQKKYGEKLTFTPLFIQAVSKAINDFPMINVSVDGTHIIAKDYINIGMATALPSGNLIVPVIKEADKKDLPTLAKEVNELVEKARNNQLKADETKGSTFTISNVG